MTEIPNWLADWLDGVSLWDVVVWVGLIIAAVVFIRRKGWRWMIAFAQAILATAKVIDNVKELPAFIEADKVWKASVDERIDEHTAQLKNSHGTNLRDDITQALEAVERIEIGQKAAYELADTANQSIEGVHGRLDDVDRKIHDLVAADAEIRTEMRTPKEQP